MEPFAYIMCVCALTLFSAPIQEPMLLFLLYSDDQFYVNNIFHFNESKRVRMRGSVILLFDDFVTVSD